MPDATYTHGHHDSVLRSHRWRTAENSAAYLLPYLRPGLSLLDVGCGPGNITADLAGRVAPGPTVGLDASAEVIAEARSTAASTARRSGATRRRSPAKGRPSAVCQNRRVRGSSAL